MSNKPNMIDERFECLSVIFRLAGRPEYSRVETDYQKEVSEKFSEFSNHPAVEMIKSFDGSNGVWVGYDCVLKFIVHTEKKDGKFVFIEDISSLFDGRWNEEAARAFLPLFNDFYIDTNYQEFFNSHSDLFEQHTQQFIDETYGKIDFEWFGKYVDKSNLRCIYSLSSGNYAATVNNKIIYCLVFGDGSAIVHEYCHSFADKIADRLYNENPEFKILCNGSVNSKKMPYYPNGLMMGHEYATRAYNILYDVQHGESLDESLSREKNHVFENSFKYIEQIYNMILELENKK